MALIPSTGLRSKLMDTGSIKSIFALGFIKIYSGTPPATADMAATGTLLCTISNAGSGTGISFDAAAVAGVISKASAETWSGTSVAGTAAYYRHVAATDDGTLSTTQPRIQGVVSTVAADMNLSSTTFGAGATQTIDYYSVTLPGA